MVSLKEFAAAARRKKDPPIVRWLQISGVHDEVTDFLRNGGSPVVAMNWLREHHGYSWETEKPLSQLRAKLREQSE